MRCQSSFTASPDCKKNVFFSSSLDDMIKGKVEITYKRKASKQGRKIFTCCKFFFVRYFLDSKERKIFQRGIFIRLREENV